jgi:flagellar P-ring protein FlgI
MGFRFPLAVLTFDVMTAHEFYWSKVKLRRMIVVVFTVAFAMGLSSWAGASRIKDVARVEGFRSNQIFGYGLVVGLNGTGDRQNTEFTVQTLANLLQDYNIRVRPIDVRVKNVAAVMVTTEVPPFVQPGTRLDATVSSMGDATSLSGGVLLLSPLKGPDGKVYAVAQGTVSLGGGYTAIAIGSKVTKNHQTAGRVAPGVLR